MADSRLTLQRIVYTHKSTIGKLAMDGNFQCWILEPTCIEQPGVKLAIPEGTYGVVLYDSPKNKRIVPLLVGVPGHSFVEIHIGNYPHDTLDCLLPGRVKDVDFVGESSLAFKELMPKIMAKLKKGKLIICVTGSQLDETV